MVAFHHADSAWTNKIDSVRDGTRDQGYYGDADLAQYLQRPVKILDQDWTLAAGSLNIALNPWNAFLLDTNVRNRVEGYRNLQGTLNLRFAINGGPFYYGRAMVAYIPRHQDNSHPFFPDGSAALKQQLSMFPHLFLDPTTSEGGTLVCPFFTPDNWIDLVGGSFDRMGEIRIISLNDLLHANSSTGKVNISVYAWMTDVRLAAPTQHDYSQFVAHAGSDEYGTGVISKPASTLAKVMGALSDIPVIRPYARASQLAASVTGRVAHVFGYSRPTIISDLDRAKLKGAGNLANTDQHEAVAKLSLDSKQELSIDPRITGLSDVDELSFDYIKKKEAFMSAFEWTESETGGTILARYTIGPDFHNEDTIAGETMNCLSPMYTVSLPFQYWHGSIKLRFQIVASELHRGRLRFCYDPYRDEDASPGENQVYSRVIDLATNRDFEMVVSWNHPRGWLRIGDRLSSGVLNHPGALNDVINEFHNGQVRVEVVNELTSPNPALAQPVYVNMFVSAGEDFEVAGPNDQALKYLEFAPQSGFEPQSGVEGEEMIDEQDNIPESPQAVTPIGTEEAANTPDPHVYFGEKFASVRALLKRYCFHMAYLLPSDNMSLVIESNFPTERGQSVAPRHITSAEAIPPSTPYTYASMTLLNWFVPCFVGWRGGLRSKYITNTLSGTLLVNRLPERVRQADCGVVSTPLSETSDSAAAYEASTVMRDSGSDCTIVNTDGAAEVEFPLYVNRRFIHGRKLLNGNATQGRDYTGENAGHEIVYTHDNQNAASHLLRYVAAADDFSCFFFVGSPPILKRTTPVG